MIVAVLVVARRRTPLIGCTAYSAPTTTSSRPSAFRMKPDYNPKRVLSRSSARRARWPRSTSWTKTPSHSASTTRRCPGRNTHHDDPTAFADLCARGRDPIGCRITVNGMVKDERSTSNVNGYIACLDKSA